jgi:hypothetical protein
MDNPQPIINQDEERGNITTFRILKNRFCGDTGVAGKLELEYNKETGRLLPLRMGDTNGQSSADY